MRAKRVLAALLATAMTAGLAAGCGSDTGAKGDAQGTEIAEGEIYECVVEYPTLGETPQDLQLVEDALNEITEEKIGVHVTLYPINAFNSTQETTQMIASGEKLDLAISIFEGGCLSYANSESIIELDELVEEYGQDILAAEGVAMGGGYVNGKLYAVPTEEKMGRVKAFEARKDLLDKYGIEYDENKIYTPQELTEIFAIVQAGEGGTFHCIAASSGDDPIYTFFDHVDTLGASYASGVLTDYGTAGTTVTNYFETEEFAELCAEIRTWYENGYLSTDCNTTTDAALTQLETGNYLGQFTNAEPDMIANHSLMMNSYVGTDVVPLYTSAPAAQTAYYQITQWMIPITCDNPEKTMQFLNLTYANKDVINILKNGIEGTHYEFVDGSDCIIDYANGYDPSTVPYTAILNVWGDKSKDYQFTPITEQYYDELAAFNASVSEEYTSEALGYTFDSSAVKSQYAAVTDVVTQYSSVLGLGVADPDTTLDEFVSALKAAGIDEIIAENQSQLDAWLAEQ